MECNKPMILLFEGISGSGKSTLSKELEKVRKYQDLTLDRFTPSMWVYSLYRNKFPSSHNRMAEELLETLFNVKVIWCHCNPYLANKRCIEKNQEEKSDIEKLLLTSYLFSYYFRYITLYKSIMKVNTENPIENNINLDDITKKTVIFKGSVKDAVRGFPQNINVAATLSLASDFKKLRIKIIVDPKTKTNTHEIKVAGESGKIKTKAENIPSLISPKTSYLAVLSAVATLKQIAENVRIGT